MAPPTEATENALRIYDSAAVAANLAHSVVNALAWGGNSGRCAFDQGSMRVQIDGAPASKLPAGSHTVAGIFERCLVDGLAGTTLNGAASGPYSFAGDYDFGAQFVIRSLSGTQLAYSSDLYAVAADGSLALSSVTTTGAAYTTTHAHTSTFTPAAGFRLVNSATGNALSFWSGSFSYNYNAASQLGHRDYNGLSVEVNGTRYTLDGSIQWSNASGHSIFTSGVVQILRDGIVQATITGQQSQRLRVEVRTPLERF